MSKLYSDNCDYCKHCVDHENWSCNANEPCVDANMFKPRDNQDKYLRCKDCEYLHENGNCLKIGGFYSSIDDKDCVKVGGVKL